MAVTELALLRLKDTTDSTKLTLRSAAKAQADYSSFPVHLFTQVEDPSYVYLLGGWRSVSHHLDEWIPGPTNQTLLEILKDEVDVAWMIHVDVEPCRLYFKESGNTTTTTATMSNDERVPLDAPVVAITRYFIAPNQKEAFSETFQTAKNQVKPSIAPWTLFEGFRLDPKDTTDDGHEKEEFVLFSGWQDSMRDRFRFAESEAYKGLGRVRESLDGLEVKHAVLEGIE